MDIIDSYFGGVKGMKTAASNKGSELVAPVGIMNIVSQI